MPTETIVTKLQARSRGFFGQRIEITRGGEEVARVRLRTWKEGCRITADGDTVEGRRKGIWKPVYELRRDDRLVTSIRTQRVLRSWLAMELGSALIEIRPEGFLQRSYVLRMGAREIGSIRKSSWLFSTVDIDLPDDWPLALKIFVFWVIASIWRSQQAAAAG
jgi:hypothetical protein